MQLSFCRNGIIELLSVREKKVLFRACGHDIDTARIDSYALQFEGIEWCLERGPKLEVTLYFEVELKKLPLRSPRNFLKKVRQRLSKQIVEARGRHFFSIDDSDLRLCFERAS